MQYHNKGLPAYVGKTQDMSCKIAKSKKNDLLLYISHTIICTGMRVIYNIDKDKNICYPKYKQSLSYATHGKQDRGGNDKYSVGICYSIFQTDVKWRFQEGRSFHGSKEEVKIEKNSN